MTDLIYLYDGTFEGFLCCVFDSYARHETPTSIVAEADFSPSLFTTRTVSTDRSHAGRVFRRVSRLAPQAADLLRRGFLTCLDNRELHLYRLTVKLLRDGPGFLRNMADDTLYPVVKAVRHLSGEAHLLRGFVRFSEFSGVLGAEIEPRNHVLPLLRPHFCGRYQEETFFIYDRTHQEALFYADRKAVIAPLQNFEMAPPDEAEASFRLLWKRFYDTIAIRERENPRCRMTNMPKRYWNTMTEFQSDGYFKPQGQLGGSGPAGLPERP